MIRNAVLVKLRDGYDEERIAEVQRALKAINSPGIAAFTVGSDLGIREGGWTFAIVADFMDVDSYRGYLANEAHMALQEEVIGQAVQIARVQFEL